MQLNIPAVPCPAKFPGLVFDPLKKKDGHFKIILHLTMSTAG
jgi:hypothetical protein